MRIEYCTELMRNVISTNGDIYIQCFSIGWKVGGMKYIFGVKLDSVGCIVM